MEIRSRIEFQIFRKFSKVEEKDWIYNEEYKLLYLAYLLLLIFQSDSIKFKKIKSIT